MATNKEYLNYILDLLSGLEEIEYRSMMGEYIIYYRNRIAAYVCDNRFLVKPVPKAFALIPNYVMESPYEGAKEMILLDSEDKTFLTHLFESIYDELEIRRKK